MSRCRSRILASPATAFPVGLKLFEQRKTILMFALLIFPLLASCSEQSLPVSSPARAAEPLTQNAGDVVAKGDRMLGIGINEGSIGFDKAFGAAREARVQVIELPVQWDDVEKQPGKYQNQWLDIANAYYPTVGVKILVSFNPIDTNSVRVPADLKGKAMDDPQVIQRYNRAVDYVLRRLNKADLIGFAIGNEIDGTLGNDARKWQQYTRFFKAARGHVREERPELPVGTKIMFDGLTGVAAAKSATINAHADVILTTYYPLGDGFKVKEFSEIQRDFDKLAALQGSQPIMLAEVGCPSSEQINSSTQKQARFVSEVFEAWDKHHERIRFVNFIWLHDISQEEVQSYTKYYGVSLKGFAEYLGTLGLRTHDGSSKPAFDTLCSEANARGW